MQTKRMAWWCWCAMWTLLPGLAWSQPTTRSAASQVATRPATPPRFVFGVISDTHVGSAKDLGRFRAFLHTIQDRRIDFLLILGDLSAQAPEYLPQMREVIDASGLKVYTVPGNHDDNYGRNPEWYSRAFAPACYSFDHKGWHFVMSDSQSPPPTEWIRRELACGDGRTPVVFCQHYPALSDDKDQMPWAELARRPNVKLVLVGHMHRRLTRQFGPLTYEVMSHWFAGGADRGTYSLVEVFEDGRTRIQDLPMGELALREPQDRAPTVTVAAPADGEVLRNGTIFRGTAGDDHGVRHVEYSVDFGPWRKAKGTDEWQFSLDTTSLVDGHHLVRVRAVDSASQPSIAVAQVMAMVENRPDAAPGIYRFQQGRNGYSGCRDVTVRRHKEPKRRGGEDGEDGDLECWVWNKGQAEFSEFYIRFDLSTAGIPQDATVARATLTLYGSRQNQVDAEGKACRYYVGLMREPWNTDITFSTRPGKPGWFVQDAPQVPPLLTGTWPYLGGRQMIIPPQAVRIDLPPAIVERWLAEPEGNHGLVVSPAPGKAYNMSAKSSRCDIITLRPQLEIELADVRRQDAGAAKRE